MSVVQIAKRRQPLANMALLAITTSLVAACAPAPYPTVGSVYPVYSDRGPVEPPPYSPLNGFDPQRVPALPPPMAMRQPEPATPAPHPAPKTSPAPGSVGGNPPIPDPVATIDSHPPGSRCGWAELCHLWE